MSNFSNLVRDRKYNIDTILNKEDNFVFEMMKRKDETNKSSILNRGCFVDEVRDTRIEKINEKINSMKNKT